MNLSYIEMKIPEEFKNNPEVYWEKVESNQCKPVIQREIAPCGSTVTYTKVRNDGWITWNSTYRNKKIIKMYRRREKRIRELEYEKRMRQKELKKVGA